MYQFLKSAFAIIIAGGLFASCNKPLPEATAIVTPAPTGLTILETLRAAAPGTYTILDSAIKKAGASTIATLSDKTGVFTFFAPTDAAFQASGIASVASLAAFSSGTLASILSYHIVPGQKILSDAIPTTFPNIKLPSGLVAAAPSASLPPGLRFPIYPSRRGTQLFVNNIPGTENNIIVANGVIHKVAALLTPPTATTIKGFLASDPTNFSILSAAIIRADSGQVNLNRFDSLLNFVVPGFTVFAPTNDAFRALFPPGTPDANIIGALNTYAFFPAQTVRGIIAYHLLGAAAFSVNFAAGPAPVNTLLAIPPTNTVVPVVVTYGGATFTVKGLANATASNVTTRDRSFLNGVVHVIDQVLRPQ